MATQKGETKPKFCIKAPLRTYSGFPNVSLQRQKFKNKTSRQIRCFLTDFPSISFYHRSPHVCKSSSLCNGHVTRCQSFGTEKGTSQDEDRATCLSALGGCKLSKGVSWVCLQRQSRGFSKLVLYRFTNVLDCHNICEYKWQRGFLLSNYLTTLQFF